MKTITSLLILFLSFTSVSYGQQIDTLRAEKDEVMYQVKIYKDVTEYLDELFKDFNDGYLDPQSALKKANLLKHEYNKLVEPVPKEAEKLNDLVNVLLSRVENYFIFFERFFHESPMINFKLAQIRFELAQEADRLMFMFS